MWKKRWVQNSLLIVFGTLAGLGLVGVLLTVPEIRNRFLAATYTCGEPDPAALARVQRIIGEQVEMTPCLGYTHTFNTPDERENLIRYNAYGFHDDDDWNAPPAESILLLGDSFAQGNEVPREDGFPRLLEDRLGQPVHNLGVQTMDTAAQIALYAVYGQTFDADHVLLTVYISNDVWDNAFAGRRLVRADAEDDWTITREMWQTDPALFPDSPAYQWFAALPYRPDASTMPVEARSDNVYSRVIPHWLEAHTLTLDLIRQLNDLVTAEGSEFAVVLIPGRYSLPPLFQPSLDPADDAARMLRPAETYAFYAEALQAEGIETLNLYPIFADWTGEPLYYEHDGHFTRAGHQLAADAIQDWWD